MEFIAASAWMGSKPGFVFKFDRKGLGYYKDNVDHTHGQQITLLSVTSSVNSGMNLKRKMDEREELRDDIDAGTINGGDVKRAALLSGNKEAIEQLLQDSEENAVQPLDPSTLKHHLLNFEKKITKNQQMRMKYVGEPQKFMESEVELNDEINELFAVAASPELYPLLVSLGAIKSILGVLTHENTDISLAAVSLLQELTDPETLLSETIDESIDVLVLLDAFIEEQGIELVVQNISRLDETQEEDALGVSHSFSIIENIVEVRPSLAQDICTRTNLLSYLITRVSNKTFDANKLHASEILAILLQNSTINQKRLSTITIEGSNGFEHLLRMIFHYRKTTPDSTDESECIENIFLCLRSALLVSENRVVFYDAEGFELMMKCLKEGAYASTCALKTINYAISGTYRSCSRFVSAGGLKYVFPVFMGKNIIKNLSKRKGSKQDLEETAISIISELCSMLLISPKHDDDDDTLPRLIAKFSEGVGEKLHRCVELFVKYSKSVQLTEQELISLRQEIEEAGGDQEALEEFDDEDNTYSKLLGGGLFVLQQLCKIMAFVCITVKDAQAIIAAELQVSGHSFSELLSILVEAAARTPPSEDDENDEAQGEEKGEEGDKEGRSLARRTLLTCTAALRQLFPQNIQ